MEKTTRRLNTVQTVLSEEAVNHLEHILHWFWNDFDGEHLINPLMQMLSVYAEAKPESPYITRTPADMIREVFSILQLNQQLLIVQKMERPCEWIDTPEGWSLPEQSQQ